MKAMVKVIDNNCCLGLLALLLLQGVISVDGRSIFNYGNQILNPKEDLDVQNKIFALLLHKSLIPVEKDRFLGMELTNKLDELDQLKDLMEQLELGRKITANTEEGKSTDKKRGEPCFWKYCV